MVLNDILDQLTALLQGVLRDLPKVQRGNKTAAQRVRTATVKLEKVSKRFRKESLRTEKVGLAKKRFKRRRKRA